MLRQSVECISITPNSTHRGVINYRLVFKMRDKEIIKYAAFRDSRNFSMELGRKTIEAFRDFAYIAHQDEWDRHCEFGRGKKITSERLAEVFENSGLDGVLEHVTH